MTMTKQPLDLQAVREQLAAKQGQPVWRSLEQLANTEAFQDVMAREFPRHASEMRDPATRRNFLKLMGASLAMAGLTGCGLRQPQQKILPYVRLPEEVIPGNPLYFASAHTFQGYAQGVLVESHDGRPTKIEGNADHPASLGKSDIFMQAAILQ
ncbi:MAG: TAT-variant-translocated molybdopterin oxidoreductase, partial [Roseiflexaceae bacterium]|nr:TAT-variant-translocated molybdopterin oxidoreductase [Roseiflexaceae bacterium]